MTQTIYRMVHYDCDRNGFFYQTTLVTPLRGPFTTRASAITDASWHLNQDLACEKQLNDAAGGGAMKTTEIVVCPSCFEKQRVDVGERNAGDAYCRRCGTRLKPSR